MGILHNKSQYSYIALFAQINDSNVINGVASRDNDPGMIGPVDFRIRQKLRAARPNQQRLAAALGKSQSWVSKYLRGGNVIADPDDLVAIAEFLGTTVGALLQESAIAPRKTAAQRNAEDIAGLWTRAAPSTRRYVRDCLELDLSKQQKKKSKKP